MKSFGRFLVLAGAAVLWAGCLDLDEEYTLNPDGSGKVAIRSRFTLNQLQFGPKEANPEESMRDAVKEEIAKAKGVDAWKDVAYKLENDGRVLLTATAYFKDLRELRLHRQGFKGGLEGYSFARMPGGITIACVPEQREVDPAKKPDREKSAQEIDQEIKAERAKYQQMKPLMDSILTNLRVRTKMNLPGKIARASNFKKAGDSAVTLSFEGKTIAKLLDEMMMDDSALKRMIGDGKDLSSGPQLDEFWNQKIFGEKGPIEVATAGALEPLFAYEPEAAPARKGQAELLRKLGIAGILPSSPSRGGALKGVQVLGIRLVYEVPSGRGVTPLNAGEPGLTLSLLAELPGSALRVKEGKVTKASSDAGEDLLPKNEFARTIHFPSLTKDKSGVAFDVQVKLPGPAAHGIGEVSGLLTYLVAEKTREVDSGITEFKPQARGKEFGALIESIKKSDFQEGHHSMELRLGLGTEDVESVVFYDESGKRLEARQSGYMSGGKETTFTYDLKGAFPPKGRIAIQVYEDLKTYEVPFQVKGLSFAGRPLK